MAQETPTIQGTAPWTYYAELAGALTWLTFGGLMFWQTFQLKGTHVGAAEGIFGPVFYPRLIAALILLCAAVLLLNMLRKHAPSLSHGGTAEDAMHERPDYRPAIAAFLGLLLYTWLLPRVGYLIVTPIMLLGTMWLMRERRWILMVGMSLGLSIGLYLIFRYVVYVLLPDGLLGHF